jgi:hypothetical protein
MSDLRHEEPPLERVAVYRGPQVPALQAYVPLPVFGIECMVLLLGMRLLGFWCLLLLPLHLILVMRTNENPFWVRDFVANYRYRWFAANRSGNAERVVVFSPHLSRREVL